MTRQTYRLFFTFVIGLSLITVESALGRANSLVRQQKSAKELKLGKLVEANIIATHAYEVMLARKSAKGDPSCYVAGNPSDQNLEALVAHQKSLLASDPGAVRAWVEGKKISFDPSKDLEPILSSGLVVPDCAPVNVFSNYLGSHSRASREQIRSVASLYQTILEIERDGDLLQDEFHLYIAVGLPVYVGQLNLPGGDDEFLKTGRELEHRTCVSPFDTDAGAWQIAGRKIWNWGEKNLHIRDDVVVARELLREPAVKSLVPQMRAMPPQKIAVIGHSFTMGLHWSSPSSFVAMVAAMFRDVNPKIQFKQFSSGGLTASRAYRNFYQDALAWKPDGVLLVVMERKDDDYEALRRLGEGFGHEGAKVYTFDDVHDPESRDAAAIERHGDTAAKAGITIIEVGRLLDTAPDRAGFVSLDGIHMTEPYHRLMAKEWLRFLVKTISRKPGE